jgi:hypothetical protein
VSRASGQKDYISMSQGLVTEASSLAFPEGATSDELNFTIDRNGLVRKRRLGFDKLVTDFTVTGANAKLENVFYWRGPSLVVVTVTDETPRTLLRFHAVDADFTFIAEFVIADLVVSTQIAQTTSLLTITTSSGINPILCEFDSVGEEIVISDVSMYIRDFELIDDALGISVRPITLSEDHKYNLFNSGWYQRKADFNDASTRKNVTDAYFDTTGEYPSNADVASIGIIDDGSGNIVFDAKFVEDAEFGNSTAPRGHFVFNIANIDRDNRILASQPSGAPSTTLTPIGTVNLTGIPTFNPDAPVDTGGGGTPPEGGGGTDPYEPPDLGGAIGSIL